MSQVEAETKEATFLIFLDSESELCLGTLIHEQWVLTAAHCFLPFLKIKIATSEDRSFQNLDLRPLLVVRHPNFTQDSAEHDIMLIKLESPLQLRDELKLAALPNTTDDKWGTTCTVVGWGWSWKQYNTDPDIQINQDVVWFSNEDCQAFSTRTISTAVPDNMFCAGLSLGSTFLCWVTLSPLPFLNVVWDAVLGSTYLLQCNPMFHLYSRIDVVLERLSVLPRVLNKLRYQDGAVSTCWHLSGAPYRVAKDECMRWACQAHHSQDSSPEYLCSGPLWEGLGTRSSLFWPTCLTHLSTF